jgi:hypothetical protein
MMDDDDDDETEGANDVEGCRQHDNEATVIATAKETSLFRGRVDDDSSSVILMMEESKVSSGPDLMSTIDNKYSVLWAVGGGEEKREGEKGDLF